MQLKRAQETFGSGTQSFAIMMADRDAPSKRVHWYWEVVNIPPGVSSLRKGAGNPRAHLLPKGAVQARNETGKRGYAGPCPKGGVHRYEFIVYALDAEKVPVTADTASYDVVYSFIGRVLGTAKLTGRYGR